MGTWLQHAALVIKGKKNVIVACVCAHIMPIGMTRGGELGSAVQPRGCFPLNFPLVMLPRGQPLGQLPDFHKVLHMREFW